jgi:hypothetical protein
VTGFCHFAGNQAISSPYRGFSIEKRVQVVVDCVHLMPIVSFSESLLTIGNGIASCNFTLANLISVRLSSPDGVIQDLVFAGEKRNVKFHSLFGLDLEAEVSRSHQHSNLFKNRQLSFHH